MHKQNSVIDTEIHPWSFIGGLKEKDKPLEKTLTKIIHREMGISVENIEFLSDSYYHARLTDNNVNQIKRKENQLLDFFTLRETEKLFLSLATKDFILKHGITILNTPLN